jgi:hypothetical protein
MNKPLAGINLYVTGRREHNNWAREALVDTLVSFLDANFRAKDAVRSAAENSGRVEIRKQEADAAEAEMRTAQTRLRLLAPPDVIDAAQELRVATKKYVALLESNITVTTEREKEMRTALWPLRDRYISAAKEAISLPKSWLQLPKSPPSATMKEKMESI